MPRVSERVSDISWRVPKPAKVRMRRSMRSGETAVTAAASSGFNGIGGIDAIGGTSPGFEPPGIAHAASSQTITAPNDNAVRTLVVPARRLAPAVAIPFALLGSAWAQDTPTRSDQLQKVEVTGSSIKRIDGETALPVQILNREDIRRSGATNAEQLLKQISATSTLGSTSVANTGPGGGQGGAGSVSLISLRGLGAQRTLVLINGRRSAPAAGSSAVDISTIPIAALDRVEILKDGASAVYGSDAVAGVVNFILRRDMTGLEVTATEGSPTRDGGGTETILSLLGGFGNFDADRYSMTLSGSYHKTNAIFGSDRSFARNIDVANQLDKTSTTSFPANIRLNNGQLRSPNYPNCGPYSLTSPLSPGLCRYDNAPYVALQPDSTLVSASANGRLNLFDAAEAYLESSLTRNQTLNTQQHVLINGAALPAGNPYTTSLTNLLNSQYPQFPQLKSLIGSAWALLPPSSPYYPTAFANSNGLTGQPLVLLFRSIPSGVRQTQDTADNLRVVAGVRGTALGWDYDSGVLYSENKITTDLVQGWAQTDKYLNLINTGVINPFGANTQAATDAALASNYNGRWNVSTSKLTGIDAKATREIYQLPAGAVSLAVGAEFRRESLDLAPSDANQQFLVSGMGAPGVPLSAKRNVASAHAETSVPIVKGLDADLAVRFDHYERVGNTTNPQGSVRWQPVEAFLLRASMGNGFRAPTLTDLYQPPARGITSNGARDFIRCPLGASGLIDCSTQFVTLGGGNPALQPEKSKTKTLGVLFEPTKNYSLGVDYFRIELNDVIRTGISTATILGDPVTYASYIRRGPPDGNPSNVGPIIGIDQSLTNLGKTIVSGYDVDVKGRILEFPEGRLTLRMNGTYLSRYDQQNLDGSFTSAINQPAAIGIGVALRWRSLSSVTWDGGPWIGTLQQNYQVGYHDLRTSLQGPTVVPRTVGPYETYDAQLSYTGFKSIRLTFGVKNLFDRDPPYTNYGAGFVGGYDLSYTDPRGRFAYLTATYTIN